MNSDGRPITPGCYDASGDGSASSSRGLPPRMCPPTGCATTTLTWAERHFGSGIARAYTGHTNTNAIGPATTSKAAFHEVQIVDHL